ncbi:phosphotransferase [Nocardia tengchongensis]|uniref:Phosphotransferase n=1 Tax=Nocardia tengchongensis TaxID=2055889 RepID=A0ABX8CG07_9NOCA|nr:phosphotransferase [Nocardia tengchongensis]
MAEKFGTVLRCWSRFAEQGAPPDLNRWALRNLDRLADLETGWLERSGGETLLHTDLRPDNLLIDAGGSVSVVDWTWPPWPRRSRPPASIPTRSWPNTPRRSVSTPRLSIRSCAPWPDTGRFSPVSRHRRVPRGCACIRPARPGRRWSGSRREPGGPDGHA